MSRQLRVIISGGGTGGHIFPAVAIANQLKIVNPATEILFVGALGRMEMEKVPAAGYKIIGLNISGIQRRLTAENLLLPFKVISSVINARKIIRSFKPDIAVGVGGYASGPLLFAANMMKVPALIQEQNSYAGITNKLLSRGVKKICVAYPGMEKYFPKDKLIITGNPVRQDVVNIEGKKEEALNYFGLNGQKKTILIVGGSLGAGSINKAVAEKLKAFVDNNIQLIWQTGKSFFNTAKASTVNFENKGIKVCEFISRMDFAYACADVVISRAGAGSISELELVAKPSILVPSPNVAEDHQTKNALALVKVEAALIVNDSEVKLKLVDAAINLVNDMLQQKILSGNISKLAHRNSSQKIVEEIYKLLE